MKKFITMGAICGLLAVALGAFGAHILEGNIPDKYLETWGKAVDYQMFHSAGLLVIGLLAEKLGMKPLLNWSGNLMLIGIILFSGSLYILSLTGIGILGAITPLGGVSFIVAWALMVAGVRNYE